MIPLGGTTCWAAKARRRIDQKGELNMAEHKYPWVPREYFPAVMFACKMIRESGYFNKAIEAASEYYNVDEVELEKHVRARQAAGQRGRKRGSFKWFVAVPFVDSDAHPYDGGPGGRPRIVKGLTKESVERRFTKCDAGATKRNDYGGPYSLAYWTRIYGPFTSKSEAEEYVLKLIDAGECDVP